MDAESLFASLLTGSFPFKGLTDYDVRLALLAAHGVLEDHGLVAEFAQAAEEEIVEARAEASGCNGPRDCVGTERGCVHCGFRKQEYDFRAALLSMMSDWSESTYCAGWMRGTEEMLHEEGGVWEILGRAIGWPSGYEEDSDFRWLTWDEAAAVFAERKRGREASCV